jgi:RNA polymerase sigma factor for flagellar operon FliA
MPATLTSCERLTARQAEAHWRAWKTRGDDATRDRLVLAYAPMVRHIVSLKARDLPAHCDRDDLVSCGLLGLMDAVVRFDPAKGATFEQYAWTRATGAIIDELRRQDWTTRSARRAGRRIERARDAWYAHHGSTPTDDELAGELKMAAAEIR